MTRNQCSVVIWLPR